MGSTEKRIYTIGYAGFAINDFIDVLSELNIKIVIDVRSHPVSAYYIDYNKDNLEKTLQAKHIHYRNYSNEFGARQSDLKFYSNDGYLDFSKYVQSTQFRNGLERIKTGIAAGFDFVLMCAEKNPAMCHRTIMIAREFAKEGYEVIHILPGHCIITQVEVEDEMVSEYFPKTNQLSMFLDTPTREEMVNIVYQKRNAEIGFKSEDGE